MTRVPAPRPGPRPHPGGGGTPGAAGEVRPKPVVGATSDAPPAVKAADDGPCCCSHLTVFLQKVSVIHKTSAFGFISATSDEVAITSVVQTTDGVKGEKWPPDERSKSLDTGQSTTPDPLAFPLAVIEPKAPCRIDAVVSVVVWKLNFFRDVKPVLQEALGKAATGAGAVAPASLGKAMTDLLDSFYHFAGIGTTLMGTITLPLSGNLGCDDDVADLVKGGAAVTKVSKDVCTYGADLENDGGKWHVELRLERECKRKTPLAPAPH